MRAHWQRFKGAPIATANARSAKQDLADSRWGRGCSQVSTSGSRARARRAPRRRRGRGLCWRGLEELHLALHVAEAMVREEARDQRGLEAVDGQLALEELHFERDDRHAPD